MNTQSTTKRSRRISLALISSIALISCAEEEQRTSRAIYNSRAECEQEWGVGDDKCYSSGGYHYGPHFIFFGGRGFYYPYASGVALNTAVQAPSTANFSSSGSLSTRGVVSSTGISRGGFGRSSGFGFGS